MHKTLTISDVKRIVKLEVFPSEEQCWILVNGANRIQMVYDQVKGPMSGVVWFFVCPLSGKRCRKLHLEGERYIHASAIRGYYRKNKPLWYSEKPINKILVKKQRMIDAEEIIHRGV